MIDQRTVPYAAFILRIAMGLIVLTHAYFKVFVFTPAGFIKYFGGLGLPAWVAYAIIVLEIAAGAALILGVWARWAALVLAAELIGTIVIVHAAKGFMFTSSGGGWEYPALWAVAAVALALIGDGPYALVPSGPGKSAR